MRTLANAEDRAATLRRLEALTPDASRKWGRMSVGKMLCHVADSLRMGHGEIAPKPLGRVIFTVFPLKHLILRVLPFPKNVSTSPELLATEPTSFDADRAEVRSLVERFASGPKNGVGPRHPFFGVLTHPEWALLQWRHLDHHLRQFGV